MSTFQETFHTESKVQISSWLEFNQSTMITTFAKYCCCYHLPFYSASWVLHLRTLLYDEFAFTSSFYWRGDWVI